MDTLHSFLMNAQKNNNNNNKNLLHVHTSSTKFKHVQTLREYPHQVIKSSITLQFTEFRQKCGKYSHCFVCRHKPYI